MAINNNKEQLDQLDENIAEAITILDSLKKDFERFGRLARAIARATPQTLTNNTKPPTNDKPEN